MIVDDCSNECECDRIQVYNETTKPYKYAPDIFGSYKKSSGLVNGYSNYISEEFNGQYGIWFCSSLESWIIGLSKEKGECRGYGHLEGKIRQKV